MYVYSKWRLLWTVVGLVFVMSGIVSMFIEPLFIDEPYSLRWFAACITVVVIVGATIYCGFHLFKMYFAPKEPVRLYRRIMQGLHRLRYDENGFTGARLSQGDMLYVRRSRPLGFRFYQVSRVSSDGSSMTSEVYQIPSAYSGFVPRSVDVSPTSPADGGGKMAAFEQPFKPFASRGPRQLAYADVDDLRKLAGWVDALALTQMGKLK